MKATIKLDGTLEITAENELEGYAISKWESENPTKHHGTKILIQTREPTSSIGGAFSQLKRNKEGEYV